MASLSSVTSHLLGEKRHSQDSAFEECTDEIAISAQTRKHAFQFTWLSPVMHRAWPCAQSCLSVAKRFLLFLPPSFLSSKAQDAAGSASSSPPAPLRSTAFLDGLRGVAAWAVMNSHLQNCIFMGGLPGWGQGGHYHEWFRLPGFVLIWNGGDYAVALFFIISGFALSLSPIDAMRQTPKDPGKAMKRLASAIFRRPIRLFLPSWVSTACIFVLVRLHYISTIQAFVPEMQKVMEAWYPINNIAPEYFDSFWKQLSHWLAYNANMLIMYQDYSDFSKRNIYNRPTWTVVVEFRASLMLYLMHAVLFFLRPRIRTPLVLSIIILGISVHGYDGPLFLIGYLMAKNYEDTSRINKPQSLLWRIVWWTVFIVGVYLGSFPIWQVESTPLYSWMLPLTPWGFYPANRFWSGLGATLTLWAISKTGVLRQIYCHPVVRYMGKISFALYLVHVWIVQGLGEVFFYYAWILTGRTYVITELLGFILGYCCTLAVVIFVADIFWRAVDQPCVDLGFKLQKWTFED